MNQTELTKLEHLHWAIESRSQNQRSAVRLLRLFMQYEDQWKTKQWARAAQQLLSVTFSLWRAAFLANKTAKRTAVFSHAKNFLEKVIEDNAISYTQDRNCNEWTFNYYTTNARASLETLNEHWPELVPVFKRQTRTPIEKWRYCQELLDVALGRFETAACDLQIKESSRRERKERRSAAKARRRKVREITFANRKANESSTPTSSPTSPA